MTDKSPFLEFVDLQAQRARIGAEIDAAIGRVLAHGRFIMGPEVVELEEALCSYTGARRCITCSSGTDALLMVLLAWGIGPGDAVFVPTFTFAATAEVVALLGATPIFVDVDDSFNLDADRLEESLQDGWQQVTPKAIIAVDLFGIPAKWMRLREIAGKHRLHLIADAAQSLGAVMPEGRVGVLADATTTSFFPSKPLGCYGDGGAILTNNSSLAETLRSLRVHGQGSSKFDNVRIGLNGRLDTLQAAILLEKLKIFDDELNKRRSVANRYDSLLPGGVLLPAVREGVHPSWAQYTIRVMGRDRVKRALEDRGIPTAIYYAKPLHLQPAYRNYPRVSEELINSTQFASEVLSLPMHPYLSERDQDMVIAAVSDAVERE